MEYGGLDGDHVDGIEHLGGNVKVGDPFTWCPSVWDYVIARFGIRSAMDVGSGNGNVARYFYSKGCQVIAVEGFEPSVQNSLYPAVCHDLTKSPISTKVDLVHCQEVVEHIDETYIDNLMATLLCGKIILITHGVPGQYGFHHVNLQPREYWVAQFEKRGAALLEEDSARIRELAKYDNAPYMADTGLIFVNRTRI